MLGKPTLRSLSNVTPIFQSITIIPAIENVTATPAILTMVAVGGNQGLHTNKVHQMISLLMSLSRI